MAKYSFLLPGHSCGFGAIASHAHLYADSTADAAAYASFSEELALTNVMAAFRLRSSFPSSMPGSTSFKNTLHRRHNLCLCFVCRQCEGQELGRQAYDGRAQDCLHHAAVREHNDVLYRSWDLKVDASAAQ